MNNRALEYGLSGNKTFDVIAGADIHDFSRQILKNGIYVLTTSQTEQLEELAEDVVWAKASDLKLKKESDNWSYFMIDTSDLNAKKLNDSQKLFAVKVHGSLKDKYDSEQELPDYSENMNMLRKEGNIKKTKIWLPTQNYIKEYIKDGNVVARASRLGDFGYDSDF